MLYYDRIDISQGIDVNKTVSSKEYNIYHYWNFLEEGFRFQTDVCNVCHDVLMISMNLIDTAILNTNDADHRCIINRISKNEAINLLKNFDLTKKNGTLKTKKFIITYKIG